MISWIKLASAVAAVGVVAGCSADMDTSLSGSGMAMSVSEMEDFCAGEAAGEFGTRPAYVSTNGAQPGTGGGWVVTGEVDQGASGNPPFQCLFDGGGRFISFEEL